MDFSRHLLEAKTVDCKVQDQSVPLRPKVYSTGSVGWYFSGKAEIDGTPCQLSFTAVIIGSKPGDSKPRENLDQTMLQFDTLPQPGHSDHVPPPSPASKKQARKRAKKRPKTEPVVHIGGPGSQLEPDKT